MTQLFVDVRSRENHIIDDAHVTIENERGIQSTAAYDGRFRRYVATDLPADEYNLRVTDSSNQLIDEQLLEVRSGDNYAYATLDAQTPDSFRTGDGGRAFFEPDRSECYVVVSGADVVDRGRARLEQEFTVTAADIRSTDEARFTIAIPDPEERRTVIDRVQEVVETDLPRIGVRGHVALPMYDIVDPTAVSGLTREFIVQYQPTVGEARREEIAQDNGFRITRPVRYVENGYLWEYTGGGPAYWLLDVSNELWWMDEIRRIEPNLLHEAEPLGAPDDFLYSQQPALDVINAETAWEALGAWSEADRYGSPEIVIGVLDPAGVDHTHPDLDGTCADGQPKVVRNFDFVRRRKQKPKVFSKFGGKPHGTQCAAAATALTNDGIGIAGVAGNCRLIGGRLPKWLRRTSAGDAIAWMAGVRSGNKRLPAPPAPAADVLSLSWRPGWGKTGGSFTIDGALRAVSTQGRNGKGTLVCCAVGNDGYREFGQHNPMAAHSDTIAVGASIGRTSTTRCASAHADADGYDINLPVQEDTRAYYSEIGVELDIVAPSHTSYDHRNRPVDPIMSAGLKERGQWPGSLTRQTHTATAVTKGSKTIDVGLPDWTDTDQRIVLGGSPVSESLHRVRRVAGTTLHVSPPTGSYPSGTSVGSGPADYTKTFGGTSHACPLIAGTIALVLSVNPRASSEDVRELLAQSAAKVDPTPSHQDGTWYARTYGLHSAWYGYGRVDTSATVSDAIAQWSGVGIRPPSRP